MKGPPFICFFFIISIIIAVSTTQGRAAGNDTPVIQKGLTNQQYINYAIELTGKQKYNHSLAACNEVFKSEPNNAEALQIAAKIYTIENKWDEAISYGERAVAADPTPADAYTNLYTAYDGKGDWTNALRILNELLRVHPDNKMAIDELPIANQHFQVAVYSKVMVGVFLIFVIVYFIVHYTRSASNKQVQAPVKKMGMVELFFIASSVSYIFYLLFFLFSPLIWSANIKMAPEDICTHILNFTFQHDGIEVYVLYAGVTAIALLITVLALKIVSIGSRSHYYMLYIPAAALTCMYIMTIGFYPPWNDPSLHITDSFIPAIAVSAFAAGLYYVSRYSTKIVTVIIAIVLVPVCFIAIKTPMSTFDYSFILAPALRLEHGFKIPEIYFQYDLLLSLICLGWIKTGTDIGYILILYQAAFYIFLLGIYLFARRLFINKSLAILFVIFLAILKSFGNYLDLTFYPQMNPLRLDYWLILLVLVYWKGTYHWIVGLAVGFFLVFHRNLGMLYAAAYIQLLILLFIMDVVEDKESSLVKRVTGVIKRHFFLVARNILIMAAAFVASVILFKGFMPVSLKLYVQLGIAFLPISRTSFYWYVPIMLGMLPVLLFTAKSRLPQKYFVCGLFLIPLSVANSMYFYGRSHEINMVGISGSLTLVLFLLFDLMGPSSVKPSKNKPKVKAAANPQKGVKSTGLKGLLKYDVVTAMKGAIPFISIVLLVIYYTGHLRDRSRIQWGHVIYDQLVSPAMPDSAINFAAIREMTKDSKDVYFLNFTRDAYFYYYGHYKPLGYFSPCYAWVVKKDFAAFMQDLLDKHYYIVTDQIDDVKHLLPLLTFDRMIEKKGYVTISKEPVQSLLAEDKDDIYHIAMKEEIAERGITTRALTLGRQFTIQCVLAPAPVQQPDAAILYNIQQSTGSRGFALQQAGANINQYVFAYGDSAHWVVSNPFKLTPDQRNYVALTYDRGRLKVYINGDTIASQPSGPIFSDSENPLVIGNDPSVPGRAFRGLIREIKISAHVMDEKAISAAWELISHKP